MDDKVARLEAKLKNREEAVESARASEDKLFAKVHELEAENKRLENRFRDEQAVHYVVCSENKILREENKRYVAALNRILDNCSDTDLVSDTAYEALYGVSV